MERNETNCVCLRSTLRMEFVRCLYVQDYILFWIHFYHAVITLSIYNCVVKDVIYWDFDHFFRISVAFSRLNDYKHLCSFDFGKIYPLTLTFVNLFDTVVRLILLLPVEYWNWYGVGMSFTFKEWICYLFIRAKISSSS